MENLNRTHLVEGLSASGSLTGKKWRGLIMAADRWGSSAYYPSDVLSRDGSTFFKEGTQIYQNHLTEAQEDALEGGPRPMQDLVGRIASEVVFGDEGEGPGLYGDIEFHDSFVSRANEAHKDFGLSVNAHGLTEDAEVDGRYGPVLRGLLSVDSVDVVTRAGAGGKLIRIIESDRGLAGQEIKDTKVELTKEDVEALTGAITALREALADQPAGVVSVELSDEDKALIEEAKAARVKAAEDAEAAKAKEDQPVDVAAIVESLNKVDLPIEAVVLEPVIAAVKAGTPLVEAVKVQTDLRDTLSGSKTEVGTVIREAYRGTEESGLTRAVKILG